MHRKCRNARAAAAALALGCALFVCGAAGASRVTGAARVGWRLHPV